MTCLAYEMIGYVSCGSCTERTHCEECARRLEEIVKGFGGVRSVTINMPAKTMTAEAEDTLDEDDLIDAMEGIGLFV